jgi:hypothetical protein
MIVKPVDRFEVASGFPFVAERIVDIDRDGVAQSQAFGFGEEKAHLLLPQGIANALGRPGADAQEIGHVRGIGTVEELPLQRRQGLVILTDEQSVRQVEEMLPLRAGQTNRQLIQESAELRRIAYNTSKHD